MAPGSRSDDARAMVSTPPLTLCGSLSLHPVSLGAAMHLAGYRALDLAFTYVPFGISDLESALCGMRALGIRGFGISMPFKQAVLPLVDAIDPLAARIGAVNTVVNDGGRLTGYNTDCVGAVRALEEVTTLAGKRALLLGAGGAARAVAHGLADRGVRLCIANRDSDKAHALAAEIGSSAATLDETERAATYDLVVNATSVGMAEIASESPIPEGALREGQIVMDLVYKPIETALVRSARRRGAITVHGGRMLLYQAARQFELYTRHEAPLSIMDEALRAAMAE